MLEILKIKHGTLVTFDIVIKMSMSAAGSRTASTEISTWTSAQMYAWTDIVNRKSGSHLDIETSTA